MCLLTIVLIIKATNVYTHQRESMCPIMLSLMNHRPSFPYKPGVDFSSVQSSDSSVPISQSDPDTSQSMIMITLHTSQSVPSAVSNSQVSFLFSLSSLQNNSFNTHSPSYSLQNDHNDIML